jgi:hypothetical protein
MKEHIIVFLLLVTIQSFSQGLELTLEDASHFAGLALKCIHQEFPNKPSHVMDDADDVRPPGSLHPAFYGCFDWHSSVHGHWMLVKLLKEFPDLPEAEEIRKKIDDNLTAENILLEVEYFKEESNKSFERTYGWAWLLKLADELQSWEDMQGQRWYSNLKPLAGHIAQKYKDFLPKLTYPNRTGEHPNTAFGLGFAWDYAEAVGDTALIVLIESRARDFYLADQDCPANYEPGGFDFLSPCLEEANLMARILSKDEYTKWMDGFLPGLRYGEPKILFEPATVTDRTDGKLVHLDGLNLSRAWCFSRIAVFFPEEKEILKGAARKHLEVTLPNIASGDYAGEHWLASFAIYAMFSYSDE